MNQICKLNSMQNVVVSNITGSTKQKLRGIASSKQQTMLFDMLIFKTVHKPFFRKFIKIGNMSPQRFLKGLPGSIYIFKIFSEIYTRCGKKDTQPYNYKKNYQNRIIITSQNISSHLSNTYTQVLKACKTCHVHNASI